MERWATPWYAAQARYLRHLGTTPAAEVSETRGLYAIRTGVFSNAENGVLSSAEVEPTLDDARRLIDWFGERNAPASWLCAEGRLRARTADVLRAAGCRADSGWEMTAVLDRLDPGPIALPDGLRVEPVASEHELRLWLDVAGSCRWFETDDERRALERLHRHFVSDGSPTVRLYVAHHRDAAVGMASAFYEGDVVLLTAVAVREAARRLGIGRALALTRLREARQRGCQSAVLAPSPDGARLYETLGFESRRQPTERWFLLPSR